MTMTSFVQPYTSRFIAVPSCCNLDNQTYSSLSPSYSLICLLSFPTQSVVGLYLVYIWSIVQIVKESAEDKVLVIGAGITLDSAMKAHSSLQGKGRHALILRDIFDKLQ